MFTKPKMDQVVTAGLGAGSAVAGGLMSNVVIDAIGKPKDGATAEEITKAENMKLYARIGLSALSVVAVASIGGKDNTATALKGAFAGMAVVQGIEVLKDVVKTDNKTVRTALGLGCACQDTQASYQPMLGYSYSRPMLRYADTQPMIERNSGATNGFSLDYKPLNFSL